MAKGMDEAKEICGRCKQINNEEVFMVEKHDMLVCPKCQTSFFIKGKSPLERYKENWNNNADEIFVLVRPELSQGDLVNPRLFFLYEDCYHTILIGRYNASIIMMGVLLETLMKERINLKLGGYFEGEYGPCLKNWPIQFEGEISLEKLSKAIKDTKSGRLKPKLLPAAEIPAFRSIAKQAYDRKRAIELFNQVYDFLLGAKIKYFKQEEYDEHNKKFGTGLENVEHYKV
ncbi:MAG: hypothetical protein OIN88_07825 [Candidatus Methanoperedens sp.]|nr:hypothetical protein [Candidatus Methanoperedens sp.]